MNQECAWAKEKGSCSLCRQRVEDSKVVEYSPIMMGWTLLAMIGPPLLMIGFFAFGNVFLAALRMNPHILDSLLSHFGVFVQQNNTMDISETTGARYGLFVIAAPFAAYLRKRYQLRKQRQQLERECRGQEVEKFIDWLEKQDV